MKPEEIWNYDARGAAVAWLDPHDALRVVLTDKGPVVELPDGKDATGEQRWIRAVLTPDRSGQGEVVLEGWKAIADALGVRVQTALAWARLPDHRLPVRHSPRGPYIFLPLLRAWLTDRSFPAIKASRATGRRKPQDAKRSRRAVKRGTK